MLVLAKKRLVCLCVICLLIAFGNSAEATTLSFSPSMPTIGISDEREDSIDVSIETGSATVVPELATLCLLGFGLIGLAGLKRKFTK